MNIDCLLFCSLNWNLNYNGSSSKDFYSIHQSDEFLFWSRSRGNFLERFHHHSLCFLSSLEISVLRRLSPASLQNIQIYCEIKLFLQLDTFSWWIFIVLLECLILEEIWNLPQNWRESSARRSFDERLGLIWCYAVFYKWPSRLVFSFVKLFSRSDINLNKRWSSAGIAKKGKK